MSDEQRVPSGEVVYDPAGNVTVGAPAAVIDAPPHVVGVAAQPAHSEE